MMVITLIIFWAPVIFKSVELCRALEMMYVVSACILDAIVVAALILVRNWGDMFPFHEAFIFYMGYFYLC